MDGLILIDKPSDVTSFGVVARIRRVSGEKKCGHAGTLDPMAQGLLPVLVGKGTKLSSFLLEGDKRYTATLRFGLSTDTYDITGAVLEKEESSATREKLAAVLPQFLGEISQIPPAFSAIKQGGVPLYKRARRGEEVSIPPRSVTIYSIDLIDFNDETKEAVLDVHCSKGTYIRSLCVDIANAMGEKGTMAALKRTETLGFSLTDALPLEAAMERLASGDSDIVLPLEKAVPLPIFTPPAFFATLLSNGCAVEQKKLGEIPQGKCWVMGEKLLGIGEKREDGTFKIIVHI